MKLDTMIQMINDLRVGAITDDTDPANILVDSYVTPFDMLGLGESLHVTSTTLATVYTWSDGSTYTAFDNLGNPYDAPVCNWLWGSGGKWG